MDQPDPCAPVYITVGDGGNREGLARAWQEPQPAFSAFREASYGHGVIAVLNETHAEWTWHRNSDGERVTGDAVLFARSPSCANRR